MLVLFILISRRDHSDAAVQFRPMLENLGFLYEIPKEKGASEDAPYMALILWEPGPSTFF